MLVFVSLRPAACSTWKPTRQDGDTTAEPGEEALTRWLSLPYFYFGINSLQTVATPSYCPYQACLGTRLWSARQWPTQTWGPCQLYHIVPLGVAVGYPWQG